MDAMLDKVLVDTSAWIDFFRKNKPERHELVATLLREGRAIGTGIVSLELLRGAKSSKELTLVSELFETIEMVYQTPSTYSAAGKIGYEMARNGYTLSTVDLLIAQIAIENDLSLLTLDQHFATIAEHFPLKLVKQ
jgi:predicted nucleic acid-binding protein